MFHSSHLYSPPLAQVPLAALQSAPSPEPAFLSAAQSAPRGMVMNMIFMTIIIRIWPKSNRGSMIMLRKISCFEYDVTLTASKTSRK